EPLAEALKHQQEVEQTLKKLLQRLEPWSGANEIRGETRALLDEQEKLNRQTDKLDSDLSKARPNKEQQEKLNHAAKQQGASAERLKQLLEKMKRLSEESEDKQKQGDKQKERSDHLEQAKDLEKKAQERERQADQAKGGPLEKDLRAEAQKLR